MGEFVVVPRKLNEAMAAAFYDLADMRIEWPTTAEDAWAALLAAAINGSAGVCAPCPFCGATNVEPFRNTVLPGMDTVLCRGCGARGPHHGSPATAIEAWNGRVAAEPQDGSAASLQQLAEWRNYDNVRNALSALMDAVGDALARNPRIVSASRIVLDQRVDEGREAINALQAAS